MLDCNKIEIDQNITYIIKFTLDSLYLHKDEESHITIDSLDLAIYRGSEIDTIIEGLDRYSYEIVPFCQF